MSLIPTLFLPLALLVPPAIGDGFLGVHLDDNEPIVTEVIENTAAAKADIKVGDKFLAVDGKKTPDTDTFIEMVGSRDAGDRVRFDVQRGERKLVLFIVLGKRPSDLEEREHEGRDYGGAAGHRPTQLWCSACRVHLHRDSFSALQRRSEAAGRTCLRHAAARASGGVRSVSVQRRREGVSERADGR